MAIRLGITGGIGSGKSGLSELLRVQGIPVYDCDKEARRLMNESPLIKNRLCALAGSETYSADGQLNRMFLATFMFNDAGHVAQVNAIVHPAVRADFRHWAEERAEKDIVAVESAILFEAGMKDDVDKVILVYTPFQERLQRVMERDNATEEQVRNRMSNQMSDEEKLPLADYIIHNAEHDALTPQVESLLISLKNCLN